MVRWMQSSEVVVRVRQRAKCGQKVGIKIEHRGYSFETGGHNTFDPRPEMGFESWQSRSEALKKGSG